MLSMASCPQVPLCNCASAPATTGSQCTTASSLVPSLHGSPTFPLTGSLSRTPSPRLSLSASPQLRRTHSRACFCAGAVKSRRKDRRSGPLQMEGFDDDADDDEGEDEMLVPFGKMNRWLDSKPRGFGVGKVYDTTIEDKLLEEIEQSRQAQAANINKLMNAPVKPVPKKDAPQLKVVGGTPSGIRVRVVNLPKKKNIHRDLKLAFDGTPGILDIVPAVSGNEKTRDPICKGFAFVDFKTEKDAVRFVETFSKQNIKFGKVQKQIKCEMMNPHSSSSDHGESDNESHSTAVASQNMDLDMEGEPGASFEVDNSLSDSWDDPSSGEEDDLDGDLVEAELGETYDDMESLTLSKLDSGNALEHGFISPSASSSLEEKSRRAVSTKKLRRSQAKNQKKPGGKVKVKVPKLVVPGSAKRLKIKEKAMLTGVFAKYGANADCPSNQDS